MKRIVVIAFFLFSFGAYAQDDRCGVFGDGHLWASSEPCWMYNESAAKDLQALNVSLYANVASFQKEWNYNLMLGISDTKSGVVPQNSRLVIKLLNGQTLTLYSNSETESTRSDEGMTIPGSMYKRYLHIVSYTISEEQTASLTYGVESVQVYMKDKVITIKYPRDIWSDEMFQQIKELTTYMQVAELKRKTMRVKGEL